MRRLPPFVVLAAATLPATAADADAIRVGLIGPFSGPYANQGLNFQAGIDALFAFLPSGPSTLAFARAYNDNGLRDAGVAFLAPGDLTQESDLPALGAAAEGFLTTFHYAVSDDSAENASFVEAARAALPSPENLSFPAVGAFDGISVIAAMIEAAGGEQDAAAAVEAVKSLAFESPRGPVTIDPDSRSPIRTIDLREVAAGEGGLLENHEIESYPEAPDLGWQN